MAKPDYIRKNDHRGDKPGGGKGGPKGPNFRRDFEVGGTREELELTVRISKGGQLVSGEKVRFWLGTETQKHHWLLKDTSDPVPTPWELTTRGGYAQAKIPLSDKKYDGYTIITAEHIDWEDSKPLPAIDATPAGFPSTRKPTEPDLSGYELHWTPVMISPGHERVRFLVRDDQYKSATVKVHITPDADVTIKGEAVRRGETKDLELPKAGETWDITFAAPRIKLVLFVEGLNKTYDVVFYGSQVQAPAVTTGDGKGVIAHLVAGWQGEHPQRRFFVIWLPLVLVSMVWFGDIKLPLAIGLVLIVRTWLRLLHGGEAHADRANRFYGEIMRTNNRWWLALALSAIVGVFLSILIVWLPAAPEELKTPIGSNQTLTEDQQRDHNLNRCGIPATDAELKEIPASELNCQPQQEQSTGWFSRMLAYPGNWLGWLFLPDQSFGGWIIRLLALSVLLMTTAIYALFAFSDEIAKALHGRSRAEQGGHKSTLIEIVEKILGVAKNPPRPSDTQAAKQSGISWWRMFLVALTADEFWEVLRGIFKILRRG